MAQVKAVYIRDTGDYRVGQEVAIEDSAAAVLAARQRVDISTRDGHADAAAVAALIPSEYSLTLIESIAFDPASGTVEVGEQLQINAVASAASGATKSVTDLQHFSVTEGDEYITLGAIAGDVYVSGVAEGNATVKVTYEGQSATFAVTVEDAEG